MFQNRINGFVVPSFGTPQNGMPNMPRQGDEPSHRNLPNPVQVGDIYQAARKKAVEDHELDKLFNPDFYDYQI